MTDTTLERVARAIAAAIGRSFDASSNIVPLSGKEEPLRCEYLEMAQAAIDEMNQMAEEEHGVPMFVPREKPRARN